MIVPASRLLDFDNTSCKTPSTCTEFHRIRFYHPTIPSTGGSLYHRCGWRTTPTRGGLYGCHSCARYPCNGEGQSKGWRLFPGWRCYQRTSGGNTFCLSRPLPRLLMNRFPLGMRGATTLRRRAMTLVSYLPRASRVRKIAVVYERINKDLMQVERWRRYRGRRCDVARRARWRSGSALSLKDFD